MRDYQKNRVYRWEDLHIPEGPMVEFPNAQAIVNHIWTEYGLDYPPCVELFDPRVKKMLGKSNRLKIQLQPNVSTKTIIHEVAHSMTSNVYGESAQHGPLFVGMYAKLIHKFMNVDLFKILQTCAVEKVDIDINAQPIFID